MKNAEASHDPAERLRIYDEIINTYQYDSTGFIGGTVFSSITGKAALLPTSTEKIAFITEMIEKYSIQPHKEAANSIQFPMYSFLERTVDSDAERLAICNKLLEKQDIEYEDSFLAELLNYKAILTADRAEKVALYDQIMQFISSKDNEAFIDALSAAMNKAELIGDKVERIRLCDLVIESILKNPSGDGFDGMNRLFDRAIRRKAELFDDPYLPLHLWNQLIGRMAVLHIQQSNEAQDDVQFLVAQAMMDIAHNSTDTEAQIEMFNAILEKCEKFEFWYTKERAGEELVTHASAGLARIAEKSNPSVNSAPPYIAHLNQEIADAPNTLEALQAMTEKARHISNTAEKIGVYDEIIARGAKSEDEQEIELVQAAIYEKSELIDGREEKIKLYETLLFDPLFVKSYVYRNNEVFQKRLEFIDDDLAKLSLYKRYITIHSEMLGVERKIWLLVDMAEALVDPVEKLRIYNEIIEASEPIIKS